MSASDETTEVSGKEFDLTADRCMVPTHGNWKMVLYCRGERAVITTNKGDLHADFERLDQEARSKSMYEWFVNTRNESSASRVTS